MTVKYFSYPFATGGDLTAIPDTTQPSGIVSYQQGFGPDYALVDTDPSSLDIPRNQFNQLMNDITMAIQQIQQNGFPIFITSAMNDGSPYAYSKNSFVLASDGNVYYSLINANTDTPPTSNWQIFINGGSNGMLTGMMTDYWGVTLPAGYVWANGLTIGNASSNATGLADPSTSALFALLWAAPSANFPIFTSLGVPQVRGANAAADYAANYAIMLPDCLERVTAGNGVMGGVSDPNRITVAGAGFSGANLGSSGGVQTYALTTAQLAAHTHFEFNSDFVRTNPPSLTNANYPCFSVQASSADDAYTIQGTADTPNLGLSSPTGSGTAHQNTQPTIICNKIIKI